MLFEHQFEGAQWLAAGRRAYLADEPGLGKTRTLIRALQLAGAKRPLVVAPAIVRSHWRNEFGALEWHKYSDTRPIICSYDWIVRRGEAARERLLRDEKVDSLVLDEAHYLKHAKARRTQLLLGPGGYARRVQTAFAASGTPMPKHPGELWPILSTFFPSIVMTAGFHTYRQWLDHFTVYGETRFGMKIFDVKNVEELQHLLGKVMLRRTLDDVGIDVPEIFWSTRTIDAQSVDPEIHRIEGMLDIEGAAHLTRSGLTDGNEPAELATYRRLVGEAKAPVIAAQLAEELEGTNEKVVVFAHHRSVLATLRERLSAFGVAYVDGDVPDAQRQLVIDRFQTDPATRVFIGQTIACQTGITLTAARRVVLVEPDWTSVVNQQAAHRVARIGQAADHCIAQMVSLAGTLDEAIVRQHAREAQRLDTVLDPAHGPEPEAVES